MIGIVLAAVALVLIGAAAGFIAVISLQSNRDKDIITPPPSRAARGARTAHGLHVRWEPTREAAAWRHDLPRPSNWEW